MHGKSIHPCTRRQAYGYGTRAGKRSLGAPVDGWIVSRRVWMAEITICMACYGRTWYGGVPIVQITSRPPRHLVGRALVHLDQAGRHKRRLRSSVSSCYAHTAFVGLLRTLETRLKCTKASSKCKFTWTLHFKFNSKS